MEGPSMNPLQQLIGEIRNLFSEIAGPSFAVVSDPGFHHLPYRFKFVSKTAPGKHVAPIELTVEDVLCMNGRRRYEKLDYLRGRFGHLFKSK
jgi:hypothetical protein